MRRALRFLALAVPAAVLLVAAAPKLAHPDAFALAVFRYQLFPHALVNALAVFVPWLEGCVGLALLGCPPLRRGAALVACGLLVAFSLAVAANLLRGLHTACGCFGVSPEAAPAGWGHVAANLALAALCAWWLRTATQRAVR